MLHNTALMQSKKVDNSTNYTEQTHDPMIYVKYIVHYPIETLSTRKISQSHQVSNERHHKKSSYYSYE